MLPRRLLGWGLVAVFCLVITTVPTPAQERGQRGGSPQSGGGDGRAGCLIR